MNRSYESPVRVTQLVTLVVGALLLGLWEALDHQFLMAASMEVRHGLHLGVTFILLGVLVALVVSSFARYEKKLQALTEELATKNASLEQLEEQRDWKLLSLAQRLSLALAELSLHVQFALHSAPTMPTLQELSAAIERSEDLSQMASELLGLKHEHDALKQQLEEKRRCT